MVHLPAALSIFSNKHQICRHLQTLGPLVYSFKWPSSIYSPKLQSASLTTCLTVLLTTHPPTFHSFPSPPLWLSGAPLSSWHYKLTFCHDKTSRTLAFSAYRQANAQRHVGPLLRMHQKCQQEQERRVC